MNIYGISQSERTPMFIDLFQLQSNQWIYVDCMSANQGGGSDFKIDAKPYKEFFEMHGYNGLFYNLKSSSHRIYEKQGAFSRMTAPEVLAKELTKGKIIC